MKLLHLEVLLLLYGGTAYRYHRYKYWTADTIGSHQSCEEDWRGEAQLTTRHAQISKNVKSQSLILEGVNDSIIISGAKHDTTRTTMQLLL